MGFIRGGLNVIASVLFLFAVFFGLFFLTVSSSLEYSIVEPELNSIIQSYTVGENDMALFRTKYSEMKNYCERNTIFYSYNKTVVNVPCNVIVVDEETAYNYILNHIPYLKSTEERSDLRNSVSANYSNLKALCQEGREASFYFAERARNITIPCSIISEGQENATNYLLEKESKRIYYEEYVIEPTPILTDTLLGKEPPLFLVSEKMHNYCSEKARYFLLIALLLFGAMLVLAETRSNSLIVAGILIGIASVPLLKASTLITLVDNRLVDFVHIFFTQGINVFIKAVGVGVLLVAIGLGFRIAGVYDYIAGWFSKILPKKAEPESVKKGVTVEEKPEKSRTSKKKAKQ